MSLLNVSGLSFRYLSQPAPLFSNVTFEVSPGDRIGLVGPNGAGKTTLLRLLIGELGPTSGETIRTTGLRLGYVPQETPAAVPGTIEQYAGAARPELAELRAEMDALETDLASPARAAQYADALARYEDLGGYAFEAVTARVLEGLGFDDRERALEMSQLSSGQRARSELAKLLLAPGDLLFIDEPTNHLDIAACEWLEGYLDGLTAAYIMVSHDRVFLSRTTNRIIEIVRGAATVYEGGYDFFVEQRALSEREAWERYEGQQRRAAAARQASERRMRLADRVATAPGGIRPNKDFYGRKAKKVARTARILRERVEREPEAAKPWEEQPIPTLDFPNVARTGDIALRVEGLSKAYGEKRLFSGLSFAIGRGERWALLGPNGTGKTTLLRILLGLESADEGTFAFGARVKVGYFAQEGENMDLAKSAVEVCLGVYNDDTWVRTILGCLRLRGEETTRSVGSMSVGERSKVAMARLLLSGANVLLLDEPTNHLDIEARQAVEATLMQFPGTILFVSHDRYFIEMLANNEIDLGSRREPGSEGPHGV